MDRAKLKTYAPQARQDFIQAMKARASLFGITANGTSPATMQGDLAFIQGNAYPKSTEALRQRLTKRIETDGFEHVMEDMAHTWFNRFAAIRYMELQGYLDHGYRVFSHPEDKGTPEILEQAEYLDLPELKHEQVIDLKLEGKDQELYRLLLVAQCNALHQTMPFLFEAVEDETELLLPDNLLHSDSLIRNLVSNLDAEDCETVEVLGWLYQFYISEKKDTVMARKSAVPKEDIPAVTQLFTPHWIVRYLVENSLGRLWLLNRPGSRLREQMPYYIEGEPEADFLKITKPEEIRILDPAVGSGHMLTYAFDLLFLIYQEDGYAPTEIPALILRHNLHGVDLCPRAAQLAGLALVFKAREKSRRFFQAGQLVQPKIIELRDVRFADKELGEYVQALGLGDLFSQPMLKLLHQFEEAKNFGSLIQPCLDEQEIAFARSAIGATGIGGELFLRETHLKVLRVLEQAEALTQRYHVAIVNPPYMGTGAMNKALKAFAKEKFCGVEADLFSMFIIRCLGLTIERGFTAMITMQSWMFLSSFEQLRLAIFKNYISSLLHIGYNTFPELNSKIAQGTAFIINKFFNPNKRGVFIDLNSAEPSADKQNVFLNKIINGEKFEVSSKVFMDIPGNAVVYWASTQVRSIFKESKRLGAVAQFKAGMSTGNNPMFQRNWFEVERRRFAHPGDGTPELRGMRWYPCNSGGDYRKWYGNNGIVVDWENSGALIKMYDGSAVRNEGYYFREGLTYNKISSGRFAARYRGTGYVFDDTGRCVFPTGDETNAYGIISLLCSAVADHFLRMLTPTVTFTSKELEAVPWRNRDVYKACKLSQECISIARADWDNFETSWDFRDQPLLRLGLKAETLEASWRNWEVQSTAALRRMEELETENNRIFIAAYGLDGELQPEVPEEQITLARADARKDVAAFLSYAVGCMMGRYSLDKPGLIYAHSGNVDFDANQYTTFLGNGDGIVPVTEFAWFPDDAALRFEAFLKTLWPAEALEANLAWVSESLDPKRDETPRETIRHYFATGLYKDHIQTYKKRPIYWLFSSGKERAFQSLVYLHRYHEGTLARMRTEYVIPLQGRIGGRIEQLREDIARATSAAHGKKLQKESDTLRKQQIELHAFDEKLRHYADLRINLNLDDGVKVNYGKFGDLLAEVKAITGGKDEE